MNREQGKYLKEKLSKSERQKLNAICEVPPFPKSVAAAKRVVDAWGLKQRTILRTRRARLDDGYSTALEAILSKDFPAALRAVKDFDKFQP